MSNVGVTFKIPNKYGNYLADLLEPIQYSKYKWAIHYDEIHIVENDEFINEFLFKDDESVVDGQWLYDIAVNSTYYLVFVTLIGFANNANTEAIRYYKDFLESNCEIALGVADSSFVMYWTKDTAVADEIFKYATFKNYEDIKFISREALETGSYQIC